VLVVAEVWLSHALPPSRRYFEKRIYEDPKDVDALCSLACFLQIVRKQDERAALMYASALQADPQVTLSGLRKAFCPKSPSEWRQKTGDQEEQGLEEARDAQGRACVGHASARAQIRGIENKIKKRDSRLLSSSTHLAYVFMKSIYSLSMINVHDRVCESVMAVCVFVCVF
jgi:hypothetical protein